MENIYDILKDAPRGLELWSSLCGECKLVSVYDNAERTNMRTPKGIIVRGKYADITDYDFTFDEFGRFSERGACLLYPSKTTSTWEFWQKRLLRRGDIVTDGDTLYLIKAELNELICADGSLGASTPYRDLSYATREQAENFWREFRANGFEFDEGTGEVRRKKKPSLRMFSLSESEYPENRMRILVWDRVRGRWDIRRYLDGRLWEDDRSRGSEDMKELIHPDRTGLPIFRFPYWMPMKEIPIPNGEEKYFGEY